MASRPNSRSATEGDRGRCAVIERHAATVIDRQRSGRPAAPAGSRDVASIVTAAHLKQAIDFQLVFRLLTVPSYLCIWFYAVRGCHIERRLP